MSGETPDNLVLVTPVEYQGNRIVRYYGFKLQDMDTDTILSFLPKINLRMMPRIWQVGDALFYEYPGQPPIAIRHGQFFTTEEVWRNRRFSHRKIRHQASILLRLLYRLGLATYNRKAIPRKRFTPYKWRKT